jgi:cation diffusion facilitator family transporter
MDSFVNQAPSISDYYRKVLKVFWIVLFFNLLVCAAKLVVGQSIHSLSMVADGFHSLLDASANVISLVSVLLASKPADEDHPYGHQKFEVLAALAVAVLMGVTCVEILQSAFQRFSEASAPPTPSLLSFGVMIFTMAVNITMTWYEARKGREYQSALLNADSAHTNSDTLSSVSVLAALACAKMGWAWMDLAAAVLVVAFVARAARDIVSQALQVLSDRMMVDPNLVAGIVQSVPGVVLCHKVRSRGMPGGVFVDLHIHVSPRLTILKAHELSHKVMMRVKETVPGVKEVYVHTEPAKRGVIYSRPHPK